MSIVIIELEEQDSSVSALEILYEGEELVDLKASKGSCSIGATKAAAVLVVIHSCFSYTLSDSRSSCRSSIKVVDEIVASFT